MTKSQKVLTNDLAFVPNYVDTKREFRNDGSPHYIATAGAKTKRDIPLSERAEKAIIHSHSIIDELNNRRDKTEYHHQFSARYKTKDFKKEDINPYLSKAPKKNKIIEMLLKSTPIQLLEQKFSNLPSAGIPVPYKNAIPNDVSSSKKHFDVWDKDVAPWLFLPAGLDNALYKSLSEQVEIVRKSQRYKKVE